ncbi:MAG: outer membrane beta-barrel protein [Acidobacteriota bacterium]|jgi:opacity protein-like surface antigen|nr:outer membrane beta-barrel protein [Acidobacteriota bacterium]
MKMKFILFLIMVVSFSLILAAASDNEKALDLMKKGREIYQATKDAKKASAYYKQAADLASGTVKADALVKIAYMSHVQGYPVRDYENLIKEALKIEPSKKLQAANYRASFLQVFNEVKGQVASNQSLQPKPSAIPAKRSPQKAKRARVVDFNKFFVKLAYAMGLTDSSTDSFWTEPLYAEEIEYALKNQTGKSSNIEFGLGYNLNKSMAIGLGAIIHANDLDAALTASVPHPWVYDSPRSASGAYAGDLKATILYLNLIYRIPLSKLSVEVFAGPAYFNTSADIVSAIAIQDVFPNDSVSMTLATENVKKSSFGFNAGLGLNYFFSSRIGVFVEGKYLSSSPAFTPASGAVPAVKLSVGGMNVGAGLVIRF